MTSKNFIPYAERMFKSIRNWLTLTELLIVVVLIAALTVAIFAALNPGERLKNAKNVRRTQDVDSISAAIHTSIIEYKGSYPTGLSVGMDETQLGTGTSGCAISSAGCSVKSTKCIDLMSGTQNLTKYLKTLPVDPDGGEKFSSEKTGYSVAVDANGIVIVRSCGADTNIVSSR